MTKVGATTCCSAARRVLLQTLTPLSVVLGLEPSIHASSTSGRRPNSGVT
ncbi:hypothetical protein RJJ65_29990 [Rhizobium hidalgonense]|uniref:Uncharacterized protein n=1 Tax=Rhizobium hidalgonense TaxID=1538159 RepID=A0AAJ2GVQ6_9HYPH|nr:hypothetical protein [Rhizobium hidalgonense]MDR9776812.1 hypothetical protein [Rhizobium hidalgonense]